MDALAAVPVVEGHVVAGGDASHALLTLLVARRERALLDVAGRAAVVTVFWAAGRAVFIGHDALVRATSHGFDGDGRVGHIA